MNKLVKKFATVGVTVATAVSLAGMGTAPIAGAQTLAELQALVAQLQAQIAALTGGGTTGGTCFAWTRSLTMGSQGADVTALQQYLTGTGHFTFAGGATGYFGGITQAAVAAWQTANGVAPAAGYWGPVSQAKYATMCGGSGSGDGGTGTSDLEGGAGSADYTLMSDFTNEEVGEAEDDQEVIGLDMEANGSDLELMAVRVNFDVGTADQDFEEYASEVSVWLDGVELGRVDADKFNDNNAFQATVTLDSGGVVEQGDTGELVVAVSGASNIDTNNVTETWTADITSVRYMDAQGSTISEDPGTAARTFSFESFATASDVELKISEADNDAVNKAHLINVHATADSNNVVLLDFELENKGSSELEIREFGVDFVVTGATHVDELILGGTSPAARLFLDGAEYGSPSYHEDADGVNVGADEQVVWDDVNFTIDAGDKIAGQIKVDIDGLDGNPDLGDTILAQITETETDDTVIWDVRDESGTQVVDDDITGTATGEANELRDVGFDISLVSTSAVKTTGNASTSTSDSGLFTIVFDLTAWDGSIFVDETNPSHDGGATYSDLGITGTGTITATITCTGSCTDGTNAKEVEDGDTARFTITADVRDGGTDLVDGFFDISLDSLLYALTDVDGDLTYTLNLTDFKTPQIFLDDQGQ